MTGTRERPFDLDSARKAGRCIANWLAESKHVMSILLPDRMSILQWFRDDGSFPDGIPWFDFSARMAAYLATADNEEEARQFARLLAQAAREGVSVLGTHRIDVVHELRALVEQANRIADGLDAYTDLLGRPVTALTPDQGVPAVGPTYTYVPVEPARTRELVRRWVAGGNDPGRAARCLLGVAVGVLPMPARHRYAEEYGAEMWALRDGPAWRRIGYAMRLASRSWRLRRDLLAAGPASWSEWYRGNE